MPFDGPASHDTDPEQLYRDRREVAARRWAGLPPERFDFSTWFCDELNQGCALGWLAEWKHDGWTWMRSKPCRRRGLQPDDTVTSVAARYFGTTTAEAERCFGLHSLATRVMHRRLRIRRITGADVGRTLLRLPVTLPAAACVLL